MKTTFAQELGQFTDSRDGKTYKTVKISDQVWMAENLAFKLDTGCWIYGDDQKKVKKYGYLYDWKVAQKVCPTGWHLPSKEDFEALLIYVGDNDHERYTELIKNGKSGFWALFGGFHETGYHRINEHAYFWSSSTFFDYEGWALRLYYDHKRAGMGSFSMVFGFSVRCIKD